MSVTVSLPVKFRVETNTTGSMTSLARAVVGTKLDGHVAIASDDEAGVDV